MPRQPNLTPPLRQHKATGLWYIFLAGKRLYLGRDPEAAERERRRLIAQHLGASLEPDIPTLVGPSGLLTVSAALLRYERHLLTRKPDYRKLGRVRASIDAVTATHGARPLAEFRGRALKEVRAWLLTQRGRSGRKHSRNYVNKLIGEVKTIWTWLVSEDLAHPDALAALRAVAALAPGEGGRELPRVAAVSANVVQATLPYCNHVVRAMVQVELLTGMRPGEVCALRRADLSLTPAEKLEMPNTRPPVFVSAVEVLGQVVWVYVPLRHKNLHRGKHRVVVLGPQAQRLLAPFLVERAPDVPLFSPREAMQRWRQERGQKARAARQRKWRDAYDANSYAHSVGKALEQANQERARTQLPPLPLWSPNMLRHAAATEAEETGGQGAGQDLLGHASPDMTAVYLERLLRRAAAVALKIG